jgi:hypothetical protein
MFIACKTKCEHNCNTSIYGTSKTRAHGQRTTDNERTHGQRTTKTTPAFGESDVT